MPIPLFVEENCSIASLTTFEVGGIARFLAQPSNETEIVAALQWANTLGLEIYPLGGGSNILASDSPFPGVLIRPENKDIRILDENDCQVLVYAGAGVVWDDFVAYTVEHNWQGLECLSGIPGRVGASPMQNIGAYGQEVAQTIAAVEVREIANGQASVIAAQDCAFAYRSSAFKTAWRGRFLISGVHFRLTKDGQPQLQYRDLSNHFQNSPSPSLAEVRQAVLDIRRAKSMLYDKNDPNHRCAGSFFMNPIVAQSVADDLSQRCADMPVYPAEEGRCKVSAAWLIEHAGFSKGYRQGRARLSDKHVLCLVNDGGAKASELQALAHTIQAGVREKYGIDLVAEPNVIGRI